MPKGPKGEKRPSDVASNAVRVMRIATGEEPEDYGGKKEKDPAAVSMGKRGAAARAKTTTAAQRRAIAKKAAQTRWKGAAAREPKE